jgi:hypothetical protein
MSPVSGDDKSNTGEGSQEKGNRVLQNDRMGFKRNDEFFHVGNLLNHG